MPSARAAALMRWIHSRRNAALRYMRDRCPRYPLARSRTTLRFLWALTARFTRAMSSTPSRRAGLLRQQLLDLPCVCGGEDHFACKPPGSLGGLVLQQVATVRAAAHHLSGTGQPEALVRPAVRLHLRHGRRRLRLVRVSAQPSLTHHGGFSVRLRHHVLVPHPPRPTVPPAARRCVACPGRCSG